MGDREYTMHDYLSYFMFNDNFAALVEQDEDLKALYTEAVDHAKYIEEREGV